MADGVKPPTELANRFEVYRPVQLALAVGDRVRITAGGKTKDGKHRLSNGSLFTVQGFTKRGDIIVDHGWVIDRDFGHLTHGYVVTSHASQGVTVDKVFVGMSSESFPATNQRTAYVAVTRGKEQAQIFTDDKERTAQGDEPAGRSVVGDGACRSNQAEADLPKSADEAADARSAACGGRQAEPSMQPGNAANPTPEPGDETMTDKTNASGPVARTSCIRKAKPRRRRKRRRKPRARKLRAQRSAICAASATRRLRWSSASATATASGSLTAWLGPWQYNPSEGLLLKFSGDLVYLVLIRGSNLDKPLERRVDQPHPCRLATASRAVDSRDDRRRNRAGRRNGADHRQHRGRGIRDARGASRVA